MFVRALLVLLLVLNLGVAAWWMLRAPPPVPAAIEPPLGVARLQLLSEVRPTPAPTIDAPPPASPTAPAAAPDAPVSASVGTPVAPAVPAQCFSFGPFASAEAAEAARALLQPVAQRVVARAQRTTPARGWRVYLPPAATVEEAQASVQRIAAAGFSDYFIVRQGAEANAIALGRYRNEDGARKRAETLAAAGFPARAEALGDARAPTWLDVVAGKGFDPVRAQAAVVVPYRSLDCARLR
ncbi:SPOR domain-containing protein [Lysobacter cavernae]|uniref:SPOR domain-containing protein n=1 Tax=Lysobacter cavernae TaxID=1685901 RepID=A0ABV7RP41_9GAMM